LLGYEAPRDRVYRERFARRQVPDTRLGIAACLICGASILACLMAALLALLRVESPLVSGTAVISLPLCIVGGIPLALGGFADEGHRRRFATVGLVANVVWVGVVLLILTMAIRSN
jgi:hypothetical protein